MAKVTIVIEDTPEGGLDLKTDYDPPCGSIESFAHEVAGALMQGLKLHASHTIEETDYMDDDD